MFSTREKPSRRTSTTVKNRPAPLRRRGGGGMNIGGGIIPGGIMPGGAMPGGIGGGVQPFGGGG
jgi:hypothetical protein